MPHTKIFGFREGSAECFGTAEKNRRNSYAFGFNGKENDNEVKGEGNQQDYGMRIYDTRLGKFLSVDPLMLEYPWYSPYHFAGNSPVRNVDLDGCEPKSAVETWENPSPGTTYTYPKEQGGTTIQKVENFWVYVSISGSNPDMTKYYWFNKEQWKWQQFTPVTQRDIDKKRADCVYAFADAMEKGLFNFTLLSAGVLSGGGTLLATESVLAKAIISTSAQLITKQQVDLIDVGADACLLPGASAALGSTVDLNIGSELSFKVVGINKSANQVTNEFINSYIWGSIGNGAGNAIGEATSVGASKLEKAVMESNSGFPTSIGEQSIEKQCIDE